MRIRICRAWVVLALGLAGASAALGAQDPSSVSAGRRVATMFGIIGDSLRGGPLAGARVRVLSTAEAKDKFIAMGAEPAPSTPEELGAQLKADIEMWTKLVKAANVKIE